MFRSPDKIINPLFFEGFYSHIKGFLIRLKRRLPTCRVVVCISNLKEPAAIAVFANGNIHRLAVGRKLPVQAGIYWF